MRPLVYLGSGEKAIRKVSDPKLIDATGAIVRMTHTTICGTDLHILKGDVPEVTKGGVAESVESAVSAGEAREAVEKAVRQVFGS